MPKYKDYILPTISLFFKSKNDIDIFIEDTNDEEFYKALFNRLVGNSKITKIFSCRCKTELVKACENDQVDRNRKRIYIADGDLDLIFSNNRKDLKYFYSLEKYCIENYLIDEDAIIEVLHDIVILDKELIKKQLGFNNWLKNISHPLIELFLHYSLTHQFKTGTKTVANGAGTYCKQVKNITVLNILRVEEEIEKSRSEIISLKGQEIYDELIYERRQNWPSNITTLSTIVSGKDFLLPLLSFRFKKIKGKETYNLKYEALRMRMAKTCNISAFDDLKRKIISA